MLLALVELLANVAKFAKIIHNNGNCTSSADASIQFRSGVRRRFRSCRSESLSLTCRFRSSLSLWSRVELCCLWYRCEGERLLSRGISCPRLPVFPVRRLWNRARSLIERLERRMTSMKNIGRRSEGMWLIRGCDCFLKFLTWAPERNHHQQSRLCCTMVYNPPCLVILTRS